MFSEKVKTIVFMHVQSQEVYGKSLHPPFNFAMNLKLL